MNDKLVAISADEYQRRRLSLPKGDLPLVDGRAMRRIIGYDLTKMPTNDITRRGILESAGWRHLPTNFLVTAAVEDTDRWGALLHVAMSYPNRDPSWDEIKVVREAFFPDDMDVSMILPRQADYINVHPHCFHLWQMPTEWGIR